MRWAHDTVDTALQRMALLLGASELAMALLGLLTNGVGQDLRTRPSTCLSLVLALALWFWYLTGSEHKAGYLVFGLAQFAAVAAIETTSSELHNGGSPIDWAPNVVALVAGFLLRARATLLVTITTATGTATIITETMMHAGAGFVACLVPALTRAIYILCDGWAAGGVCTAIRQVANRADAAAEVSELEQVNAARLHSAEAAAAELARILHDSAVNTFAAIASGRLTSDPGTVMTRCGQDVKTLMELLRREGGASILEGPLSWQTLRNEGVHLTLLGATEITVTEMLATLPGTVSHAFMASLAEAVRNVAKHSGVTEAVIAVRRGDIVEFTVADGGRGFDAAIPTSRGLQRSIIDRCTSAGIDVEVASTLGRGTTVRLSYRPPSHTSMEEETERESREFLTSIVWLTARRLMSCLLALCATLTLLYSGDGVQGMAAVALLVMALTSWLLFGKSKRSLSMPAWLIWTLILAIPIITLAPGWDQTECARVGAQAWGSDGSLLPMLMIVMLAGRRWAAPTALLVFIASITIWILSVARQVPASCPSTATTSAAFNIVIVVSLWVFRHKLWDLTAKGATASKAATAARLQAAAMEAAARVRGVRQAQVLRSSLQLLNQIADGVASPYDKEVTRRCRSEESYLRELTLLDPSLTFLGEWLARALAVAHERGASLRIRSVASDTPDAEAAAFIGNVLLAVTQRAPANSALSFGIYERDSKPIASIVGSIGLLRAAAESANEAEAAWSVSYAELDDEALIELTPHE